ncbi:probable E3 ubiquitin-protein ligase TRIML1 [Leucoraja erinacea]|uniref:probable E3 ubiquitin-protein ligase TRIML1 n=1 Tax=Leucoraja erinaceus TaxID=7782 RepID=UPI0024552C17|nr:probable E3 ubiquitin-protein ligase TRIML1 [Leucoraja erinacea]
MAAKDQVESLTEEATCPIYLDFFADPVILECGHNFCRSCITQSWDKERRNSCPECREEFVDRSLGVNRALGRLSEKVRTLSLNRTEKESKLQCEEHQEELKLFCETDKKLICLWERCLLTTGCGSGETPGKVSVVRPPVPEAERPLLPLSRGRAARVSPRPTTPDSLLLPPVSVTLDVETAHPQLEVSEDRKRVRRTRTRRRLPDTGKRFTDWGCALGSEGFTSGRHCWEVEVAGNQWWSLGVAAECVEGNGEDDLTPETGVWSIRRWDDEFDAFNSHPSRLPDRPIPRLSYVSGTVSFYDADTKSPLYISTGNKFTEKCYPLFGTCDENWLRTCSGSAPGV